MTNNDHLIHPELRQMSKLMPRFTYNRLTVPIMRFLSRFQPKAKIPADILVDNISIPGKDPKQKIRLRIYKPNRVMPDGPGLLWIHGGGLIIGRPEMDDGFMSQIAQELGMVVVSVDYRLAPDHPFPAPLDDCYTALKWVCAHGPNLDIDPKRIAIGGTSAGGGLAAALAQLAHDRGEVKPVFQLLVYPMLDDRSAIRADVAHKDLLTWTQDNNRFGWESYLKRPAGSDPLPPYAVPARRENLSGLPPAWIGVGTLDLFYDEDTAYAQKLKDCGVDCDLVVVPGAFHGFDVFPSGLKVVEDFRKSQIEALRRHLFAGQ